MADLWQYEPADPSVGIFGESVIHACEENPEFEQAEEGETQTNTQDGMVVMATPWTCPRCGARTVQTESYPVEHFEEPR